MRYDLLVIGSDPAGQEGALTAARMKKRVAVVQLPPPPQRPDCCPIGTINGQTVRKVACSMSQMRRYDRSLDRYIKPQRTTMQVLRIRMARALQAETTLFRQRSNNLGIDLFTGPARFHDSHTVEVNVSIGNRIVQGENLLLACGTRPSQPGWVPFDAVAVFDAEDVLAMSRVPQSMIVVGGSALGLEYAMLFAQLGVAVTVVEARDQLADDCLPETADMMLQEEGPQRPTVYFGKDVVGIERRRNDSVAALLDNGEPWTAESLLYCGGRFGNTDDLDLQAADLQADEQGRLWCSATHQTWVPHIYGVGDVVGFPRTGEDSLDSARQAVCHAFRQRVSRENRDSAEGVRQTALSSDVESERSASRLDYSDNQPRRPKMSASKVPHVEDDARRTPTKSRANR